MNATRRARSAAAASNARERAGEGRAGVGRAAALLRARVRGAENRAALASAPKGKRRPATVRNDFFSFLFPIKF
jgi:hypothetical protein